MNINAYQDVLSRKAPLNARITELMKIIAQKKPLNASVLFYGNCTDEDRDALNVQFKTVLPEEQEISSIQEQLSAITKKTFNNPYWLGYIEPGESASIFIDHRCLWIDSVTKVKLTIPPYRANEMGIIPSQVKLGLDRLVTKKRLIDIAEKFGAETELTAQTLRHYKIGTREEVSPQDDEAYSTYHEQVSWMIRRTESEWELLFSPEDGAWFYEDGENTDRYL